MRSVKRRSRALRRTLRRKGEELAQQVQTLGRGGQQSSAKALEEQRELFDSVTRPWGSHRKLEREADETLDRLLQAVERFEEGDACLVVTKVVCGSPAFRSGVRAGDGVLGVDGHAAVHPISAKPRGLRLTVCPKRRLAGSAISLLLNDEYPVSGVRMVPTTATAVRWLEALSRGLTNVLGWDEEEIIYHLSYLGEHELVSNLATEAMANQGSGGVARIFAMANSRKNSPMRVLHSAAQIELGDAEGGRKSLASFLRKYALNHPLRYSRLAEAYMYLADVNTGAAPPSLQALSRLFRAGDLHVRRVALRVAEKMGPEPVRVLRAGDLQEHLLEGVVLPDLTPLAIEVVGDAGVRIEALADAEGQVTCNGLLSLVGRGQLLMLVAMGTRRATAEYDELMWRLHAVRNQFVPHFVPAVCVLTAADEAALHAPPALAKHLSGEKSASSVVPLAVLHSSPTALGRWEDALFSRAAKRGAGADEAEADALHECFESPAQAIFVDGYGQIRAVGDFDVLLQAVAELNGHLQHSVGDVYASPPFPAEV